MSSVFPTLAVWIDPGSVRVDHEDVAAGLVEVLRLVPDPRGPQGQRYRLASVLAVWFAAVLADQPHVAAAWEWASDLPADLLAGFGFTTRVPSERAFRRIGEIVDPIALSVVLTNWLAGYISNGDSRPVPEPEPVVVPCPALVRGQWRALALDGKRLCGARHQREDGSWTCEGIAVAVWHDTGVVAGHARIVEGDEIAAVEELVGRILLDGTLAGVVATTDSLHTHEHLAGRIRAKGGTGSSC